MKRKAQELRDQARKNNEEEKRFEREREKKRISYGKELMEAKRVLEENERKRYLALKQSDKEEEKRAKEKIKWKLEQDKLERRGKVQMPLKSPAKQSVVQQKQISHDPIMSVSKVELMSECLRSLKRNHMDNEAKVRRAFQTLLTYVGNVARDPNQEKFRKIRMSNPKFQERIGGMKEGVEFLELCGFERREEFLYLGSEKVNMTLLNSAGSLLKSAITNPFFARLNQFSKAKLDLSPQSNLLFTRVEYWRLYQKPMRLNSTSQPCLSQTVELKMIYTAIDTFYLTHDQLQNSPSRKDNIDEPTETTLRIYGCDLIQESGILLRLPQAVMATAQVLFHRFYCKKSFARFNVKKVAASCVWLAAKLEECPRKARQVIIVFHRMECRRENLPIEHLDPFSKKYSDLKMELSRTERHILKEMGFICHVEHPHKFISNYLATLETPPELTQEAWNLANDSLRTTLCVRFKSEVVACGVVYAAARRFQVSLPENPPWWKAFDAEKSGIDEVCKVLAHLYSLPKAQYLPVCKDGDSFTFSNKSWDSHSQPLPKVVPKSSPPVDGDTVSKAPPSVSSDKIIESNKNVTAEGETGEELMHKKPERRTDKEIERSPKGTEIRLGNDAIVPRIELQVEGIQINQDITHQEVLIRQERRIDIDTINMLESVFKASSSNLYDMLWCLFLSRAI
ncbi:hypothetical protein G4B88_003692 [Cannabis sativa]|uniref:Cyclin-L1-1 n=1 Tax=Cannabis sativa TaxID=3483 RepID=A0A7J6FA68_CANSA|nr:hypothetical protein G4B88_003692 [Cannabis sativa]